VAETHRVVWDPDARDDLREIVRFIAEDSVAAARRVAMRMDAGAQSLRRHPQRGRRVPELSSVPELADLIGALEVRELIVRPWRLTYVIEGPRVRVVAVVDSRRDMVAWLERHVQRVSGGKSRDRD
jgi:plasmid stabilization system protein ParE